MFFLLGLLCIPCVLSIENYFIKPTPNERCPGDPCLTISEFADSVPNVSSIGLIFMNGEHILSRNLSFKNLDILSIDAIHETAVTTLSCLQYTSISVHEIINFSVLNMTLIGCTANAYFINAYIILLNNFTVKGYQNDATNVAIYINHAVEIHILNSLFGFLEAPGCALFEVHNSNMKILHSEFHHHNTATSACDTGSMIRTFNSNVTIESAYFADNKGVTGGVQKQQYYSIKGDFL